LAMAFQDVEQQEAARQRWSNLAKSWAYRDEDIGYRSYREEEAVVPLKTKRKAAYQVGVVVDACLRKMAAVGLADFAEREGEPAATWPTLSLSMDQGSDNMSFAYYSMYHQQLNVQYWWDMSHGVWRDVDLAINSCGLRPWVRLCCLAFNLGHGPWEEGSRYWQMRSSFSEYLQMTDTTDPLFVKYLERLARDFGIDISQGGAEEAVRQQLIASWSARTKGEKCVMCRFGKFVDVARDRDDSLTSMLMQGLYMGLSENMFTLQDFRNSLVRKQEAEDNAGDEDIGSTKRSANVAAKMRSACKNNVMCMVLVFQDRQTQPKLRIMWRCLEPIRKWYGLQSQELRDVFQVEHWVARQLKGEMDLSLQETLGSLEDGELLQFVGFAVDSLDKYEVVDLESPMVAQQGELAQLQAKWVLSLVGNRLRRVMWLQHGWVGRQALLLGDDADNETMEMRADYECYQAMCSRKEAWWRKASERCYMVTTPVRQLLSLLQQSDWVVAPEVEEHVRARLRSVVQSKICEDLASRGRRAEQHRQNAVIADKALWASMIESKVLSETHHYKELDVASSAQDHEGQSVLKGNQIFENRHKDAPAWLRGILGARPITTWYSSTALGGNQVYCDVILAKHYLSLGDDWARASSTWISNFVPLGLFFRNTKEKEAGKKEGQWYLSLGTVCSTVLMGWPCVSVYKEGALDCFRVRKDKEARVRYFVVDSFDSWSACSARWMSPAEQVSSGWRSPREAAAEPALLARPDAAPRSLLEEAAHCCFWDLGQLMLNKLVQYGSLEEKCANCSTAALLNVLLQEILPGVSEDQRFNILGKRATFSDDWAEVLESLEDAEELVPKTDMRDYEQEKETVSKTIRSQKEYRDEVFAMKKAMRAKKAKLEKAPWGADGAWPPGCVDLCKASELLPPESKLYRDPANERWQVFLLGRTRSHAWLKYGYSESLRRTVAAAWQVYMWSQGMSLDACPVAGLWTSPGPAAPKAKGAAKAKAKAAA